MVVGLLIAILVVQVVGFILLFVFLFKLDSIAHERHQHIVASLTNKVQRLADMMPRA